MCDVGGEKERGLEGEDAEEEGKEDSMIDFCRLTRCVRNERRERAEGPSVPVLERPNGITWKPWVAEK